MNRTLVVLALSITLASPAFAQTSADETAIREITIGTAVPSGHDFVLVLDERSIDLAYPEWVRPLPGAWTTFVSREQFRSVVREVVRRKLAARVPDASRMKLEIKVRLGASPEITVGC